MDEITGLPVGSKITSSLRNVETGERIPFPAVILSEKAQPRPIQLAALPATDRYPARPARTITGLFQMALSLRTSRPDEKGKSTTYLRLSFERTDDLRWSPPRFSAVPGLDVDPATGELFNYVDENVRQTMVEKAIAEGEAYAETVQAERAKAVADAGIAL